MSSKFRESPSGPVGTQKTEVTAVDHGTITAATVAVATAAVTGVTSLMAVSAMPVAALKTGLAMGGAQCITDGEVAIYVANPTASPITTGAVTYRLVIHRFSS